ncbi:uncharacterized protein LOC143301929 [Babylonia areolata]|uniref:uncharacterized protein LOC143301929 n=1 Tax=Babylonia areolata TaxID=304850 RepID=UPI003FD211B7
MASQTLDDTVVALLSMGFEFQDAQDAIQYGKIAVQDAVEWILAGKPGYAERGPAPPTLKLTNNQSPGLPSLQPDTGAPFISPLPVPTPTPASSEAASSAQSPSSPQSAAPSASGSCSDMDMEQQVVSRLHLNDAKLAEKKHFEEKVRAEVEKKARLEKAQAKRERARVLKEIAEDRKMSKIMKTYNPAKPVENQSEPPKATTKATCSTEASSSVSSAVAQCSIQIRLPSGRRLCKKLDSNTTLGQLWVSVLQEAEAETEGYSGFMQPFPRREFSAPEMNKTLQQLGLVPSGSLVLKKMDTVTEPVQSEPEREAEAEEELPPEAELAERNRPPYGEWTPVNQHVWGRGRTLEGQDEAADGGVRNADGEDEEMAEEGEDLGAQARYWGRGRRLEDPEEEEDPNDGVNDYGNDDDDDDDDDMGGWNAGGARGVGANPILQGFFQQHFAMARGVFEGVGQRLVPEGVPGADDHQNRRVGDLAAEAAQQRLAQPEPVEPSAPRQLAPTQPVRRLETLSMAVVIDRITSPTNPVHSLRRLPESLSEKILHYLLQKNLLDAKTLRLFCSCCLRKLILDTYNYATNELLYAARLHPTLQILSLHSCPLISDKGIEYIADLKNLKVLNLGLCKQITNKSLMVIAGFPHLHTLSLEETGVTEAGLIKYLATKPGLRNLNLNRTAVTSAIFQHLKNLDRLEMLCLEETKVSSLDGVQDLKKLSCLNLASTEITADQLCHLVNHPALTQLSLSNTENLAGDVALLNLSGLKLRTLCLPDRHTVTSAGLAHISSFALHTLDLTNYIHVGDEGMEHVAKITSLETLMLSNTKVTDAGLLQLGGLKRLKILHLDRTCVSDVGIAVVSAFRELSELSLSATNVTNRFLRNGILHACQGLTKLNLSRTYVGDRGVEKLALPYLTLLNLDCTGVHAAVVDTIRANCPSLRSVTTANLTPVLEEEEEEEEG